MTGTSNTTTTTVVNAVPYSPLTLGEILNRRQELLKSCGYRCEVLVEEYGGEFDEFDLAYLRTQATGALAYGKARDARVSA